PPVAGTPPRRPACRAPRCSPGPGKPLPARGPAHRPGPPPRTRPPAHRPTDRPRTARTPHTPHQLRQPGQGTRTRSTQPGPVLPASAPRPPAVASHLPGNDATCPFSGPTGVRQTEPVDDLWPAPTATGPVRATVRLPGSKSMTNRALLLGAVADGP